MLELNASKAREDWSVADAVQGLDTELAAQLAGASAAYAQHWGGSLSYLGTEVKLTTPLPGVERVHLVTTLDGLATTEKGDLVVVDQKTTTSDISPGSWFWEKLQVTLQPGIYIWAARAHSYSVSHALWDAVKRPTMARRTEAIEPEYYKVNCKGGAKGDLKAGTGVPAETVPEFARRVRSTMLAEPSKWFQRAPVYRLDDELNACLEDVQQEVRRLLWAWDNNEFPRNTSSCWAFGRRCEYFEICAGAARPTDDTLYQIRKEK